jgi:hypothetical protein
MNDNLTISTVPLDPTTIQARLRSQVGETTGMQTDAVLLEAVDLIEIQRDEISKLREAQYQYQEYERRRQYPEPFKVGAVLGRRGNMSYALQILHVWNNWPNVDIEVGLP